MIAKQHSIFRRVFEMTSNIKVEECRATVVSFLMIFTLMASYFLLRPIRDAMASDWSDAEVSFLWTLQFFISVGIVSAYGFLISRVKFKLLVPLVYGLFAASFVAFYFVMPSFTDPRVIEKTFYVWVSAFSLFHLSVFWSLMSDTFSKEQGKRLFAVIAAGGSAGAIIGPAIPAFFATHIGLEALMLIAACGLSCVVPMVFFLHHLKRVDLQNQSSASVSGQNPLGGHWWKGFKSVFTNRYLLGIAVFILLYVFIGSFVYFEQKNLLAEFSRTERATILGSIDGIVNTLTFIMAFFVTSRVVTKLGMPVTLMLLPIALIAGMLALAIAPMVIIMMAVQISRRAGNYSVTRPAREMLFSQVTQEERFKAKPVIDIVIYRGGDVVSGTLFALLSETMGLGLATIALIGAGISAAWAAVAVRLGKSYERSNSAPDTKTPLLQKAKPATRPPTTVSINGGISSISEVHN